jgi:purine-binding chemotaxis protein CheW
MPDSLDWHEAYSRLEEARRLLEAGETRTAEDVRNILAARAAALARPEIRPPVSLEPLDLTVFQLAGQRYAIEAMHVLEVCPFRQLTPVPSAPPVLLGIMNLRGRILPVLDLLRLFGLSSQPPADAGQIVAVEVGEMRFGFQVGAVSGTIRVDAHALVPLAQQAEEGGRQIPTRGVTADMVTVLDAQALADDPRILIDQGGG